MTLAEFCIKSHLPVSVVRATVRQAGGWESFKEMAADVSNHGANGGFRGFIYYNETVPFSTRNKAGLLEMAQNMADELGEPLYEMIGGFNCLKISEGEAAEAIHNPRSAERTNVPERARLVRLGGSQPLLRRHAGAFLMRLSLLELVLLGFVLVAPLPVLQHFDPGSAIESEALCETDTDCMRNCPPPADDPDCDGGPQ